MNKFILKAHENKSFLWLDANIPNKTKSNFPLTLSVQVILHPYHIHWCPGFIENWAPDLQVTDSDFTKGQGTSLVIPIMFARWHIPWYLHFWAWHVSLPEELIQQDDAVGFLWCHPGDPCWRWPLNDNSWGCYATRYNLRCGADDLFTPYTTKQGAHLQLEIIGIVRDSFY